MKFGPWYPLAEAAARTPAGPGVFQLRLAEGLLDYPTGKSAMVHYGWSDSDLRAAVLALGTGPYLCRHGEEMTAEELRYPRTAHDRLREQFVRRFGAAPRTP